MSLKAHVAQKDSEKSVFVSKLVKEKCDEFSKVILVSNGKKASALQDWLMKTESIKSMVISGNLEKSSCMISHISNVS